MHIDEGIYVIGDVHGEFGRLNTWLNYKQPSIVLQCGDFGYWPNEKAKRGSRWKKPLVPKMNDTTLYWCDGNHEDFHALQERPSDEVHPNVFYMPRGTTLELPDGRTVLFMGGAESHDKEWRIEYEANGGDKIWFSEERITEQNIHNLPDKRIDIIISHAAPREFDIWGGGHDMLQHDPSRLALSSVLHRYKEHKPLWFFGHYHARIKGEYHGVKYHGLNKIGDTDWWLPFFK
jgi:predicted phosphodiesterase